MKKVMLFLMVLIFSFGVANAQRTGVIVGAGTIWTDSLGFSTDGGGTDGDNDSSWVFDTRFSHNWYKIIMEGNTNSPVDSVYMRSGSVRYNEAKVPVDTIWGSWIAIKDSAWGDINVMINNTVGKDFLVFSPVMQLWEFGLLNHRGGLVTRNVTLTVQAVKQ